MTGAAQDPESREPAPAGARARGIPFVVSAPSGTGKTSVCRALVARDPGLRFSVSHTTRAPRPGEVDGVDYHFVDEATFLAMVKAERFLEHAEYSGSLYGTSHAAIDGPLSEGQDVLLEIEVQGAGQVRERRADARFIFLVPPSMAALEARLRGRGTDGPEVIHRRLAVAGNELAAVRRFDYVVVNDRLEDAIAAVAEILAAERSGQRGDAVARHGRETALARGAGALAELREEPPPA